MHEIFAAHAARTPDAIALVYEGERLSYGELDRRANRLAHHLRALGVGPEVPVGLCLERSVAMITGLLGILKAGGAYVALEPSLPSARQALILEDSGARVVVQAEGRAVADGLATVSPHGNAMAIAGHPSLPPQTDVGSGNLAYILFTSGSTGRPKGVGVAHRQLVSYVRGVSERLDLPAGASYATVSTIAADLGNTAVFGAWLGGGVLHVVTQERLSDPHQLAAYVQCHAIDCLKIVPSHMAALLTHEQPAQLLPWRALVLGGETCNWSLVESVRRSKPGCRVLNHYGPTESTVGVATHELRWDETERCCASVPLGMPLAGRQLYVVDDLGRLAPAGTTGRAPDRRRWPGPRVRRPAGAHRLALRA